MKRKYADYPNWKRVIEKRFRLAHIDNDDLLGNLSILYIDKVREPLVVEFEDREFCLANDGFIWTQYFPNDLNYVLTTMFNEEHQIIQLYFDICEGNKINSKGIPYFNDLYLDVVLLPSGEVILLDEDELKQALEEQVISKKQFEFAQIEVKKLINYVKNNQKYLLNNSKKYLDYMMSL